jgi:hypothetical protein
MIAQRLRSPLAAWRGSNDRMASTFAEIETSIVPAMICGLGRWDTNIDRHFANLWKWASEIDRRAGSIMGRTDASVRNYSVRWTACPLHTTMFEGSERAHW